MYGGVAQLGERLPCTQEAIGSIPFTSTTSEVGRQRTETAKAPLRVDLYFQGKLENISQGVRF